MTKRIDLTSPVEVWGCELPRQDYEACSLTLFNLSGEQVTSVEVTLVLLDDKGEELARLIHRARSLNGAPGKAFVMSVPAEDVNGAVDWDATVDKVWYDNNSVWRRARGPLTEYEPNNLPHSNALTHLKMVVGDDAVGFPREEKRLWLCVCGRPSDQMTFTCPRCGRTKDFVFQRCSEEAVKQVLQAREDELAAQGRAAREEASRRQLQREEEFKRRRKRRSRIIVVCAMVVVLLGVAYAGVFHVLPEVMYRQAAEAFAAGEYRAAEQTFLTLKTYRDSQDQVLACRYSEAVQLMEEGNEESLASAKSMFKDLGEHSDAAVQAKECDYRMATLLLDRGDWGDAAEIFTTLDGYRDSLDKLKSIDYINAEELLKLGEIELAREGFQLLEDYADAPQRVLETWYLQAQAAMEAGDADSVLTCAAQAPEYPGMADLVSQAHYARGTALREKGDIDQAAEEFLLAGDYLDAADQANVCFYAPANEALAAGRYDRAAQLFSKILDYQDARE